ncbi:DUF58 domain-containing protein [Candidatus Laterigemmans baculatus]|uniref:DUF58 domain-containing protein n=1 Tax=Candidatus Laterigemmans baculatus TaxID=2770505 RepID=UPI0013DAD421|nr:DUF58 domain-containing protein [Candidatus Laterigemmans baculatus]
MSLRIARRTSATATPAGESGAAAASNRGEESPQDGLVGRFTGSGAGDSTAEQLDPVAATTPAVIHSRITRNGLHMAFVAAFAILGGSIRGFNLLVILAGLMVGLLVVQWRFCRGMLPKLTVRRVLPLEAYAERPFKVQFVVVNGRSWLPAWMIRAEDRIRGGRGKTRDGQAICSFGMIRPQTSEPAHYECTVMRRGRYYFGPVRLASGFPLGLVQAWLNTRTRSSLLVYPSIARLAPNWSEMILNRREGLTGSRQRSGQNEGDFFGIRSWQSGDSRRWIHWRTTARINALAVRQFEQPSKTQLSLILDPYLPAGADDRDVEWAISVTAAMVLALSAGGTNHLVLGIADAASRSLASHHTFDFRRGAMNLLATTRPVPQPTLAPTLERVLRDGNPNWPILLISPRAQRIELLCREPDGPAERGESAVRGGSDAADRLTPALLARLDLRWLDVTSSAADGIFIREPARGST